MSGAARLTGIFLHPVLTARSLAERPGWVVAFIVGALVLAVAVFLWYPIQSREGFELFRDSSLAQRMTAEQLQVAEERALNPSAISRVMGSFVGPVLFLLLVSTLLFGGIAHGIARIMGGQGNFRSVFALVAHGRLIDPALGSLVALPLVLAKGSVVSVSLSLAALFPNLQAGTFAFGALGMFSLFGIWFFVVAMLGMQEIHRLARGRAAVAVAVPYLALGLIGAAIQSLF